MKPFFSLIIPCFNAQKNVEKLLESIAHSKDPPPYEIIVIDDGSTGPGAARNKGAKKACGEFLVFLDSDVEVLPDTLYNLTKCFQENPETSVISGTWIKEQDTKAFFPNFKALRDFSYWNNERDRKSPYVTFSPRIGAIKRSVFLDIGGFDEFSKLEDFELTYRIAQKHPILFADTVRVKHEFEGFWTVAKKYFIRSDYWIRLYEKRRKFDPVGSTLKEGLATLSGVGVILSGLVSLFWFTPAFYLFIVFLLGHIFLLHKFILLASREKGIMFAVKSLLTGLLLYCFILAGVFWGKIKPQKEVLSYE